jgi:hypothetical protein
MAKDRKNKNKKIAHMNMEEVRSLMLQMQNDGHTSMKKYEHLQSRLKALRIAENQREIASQAS